MAILEFLPGGLWAMISSVAPWKPNMGSDLLYVLLGRVEWHRISAECFCCSEESRQSPVPMLEQSPWKGRSKYYILFTQHSNSVWPQLMKCSLRLCVVNSSAYETCFTAVKSLHFVEIFKLGSVLPNESGKDGSFWTECNKVMLGWHTLLILVWLGWFRIVITHQQVEPRPWHETSPDFSPHEHRLSLEPASLKS